MLLSSCASYTERLKHVAYHVHVRLPLYDHAYSNVVVMSFAGSLFFPPGEKRHPGNGFDIVAGYVGISDFPQIS